MTSGSTFTERWVVLCPSFVPPRIGVASDPAYVVGTRDLRQEGSQCESFRQTDRRSASDRHEPIGLGLSNQSEYLVRYFHGRVHRGNREAASQSRAERCRSLLDMPDLLDSADDEHAFEI